MAETKKGFSLRKLLESKKATLAISLIAAIIFWMVITAMESPDSKKTVTGIPVSVLFDGSSAKEKGWEIVNDVSGYTATVEVQGPAYVVSALGPDDFSAVAWVTNTVDGQTINEAGTYEIFVEVSKQGSHSRDNFEIISSSPQTVEIKMDKKREIIVDLEISSFDYTGKLAENFVVSELPHITDTRVNKLKIKGPSIEVNKVYKAVAVVGDIADENINKSQDFDAEIKLYDKSGNELPIKNYIVTNTEGAPVNMVKVALNVKQFKQVKVKTGFQNIPEKYTSAVPEYLNEMVWIYGDPIDVGEMEEVVLQTLEFDSITIKKGKLEPKEVDIIPIEGVDVKLTNDITAENIRKITVNFVNE